MPFPWEDRALEAMALALENHPAGRPATPLDAEKEEPQTKVWDLEKKLYLAEKTIEVKDLMSAYETFRAGGAKKKKQREKAEGREEAIHRIGEWRQIFG